MDRYTEQVRYEDRRRYRVLLLDVIDALLPGTVAIRYLQQSRRFQ